MIMIDKSIKIIGIYVSHFNLIIFLFLLELNY